MKDSRISVIVPVYNTEKYLRKCVDSLLAQSYDNLEIILVDDGSTDSSPKICDEYQAIDTRVRVIHSKNGGPSRARNSALDIATGDFISFVDSDDWIESGMFAELIKYMDSNIDIVSFFAKKVDDSGELISHFGFAMDSTIAMGKEIAEQMLADVVGSQVWLAIYKKKCWNNVRFPVDRIYEDIPTTYKAYLNANFVAQVSSEFYNYRTNRTSICHNRAYSKNYPIFLSFYDNYSFAKKESLPCLDLCTIKTAQYASTTLLKCILRIIEIPETDRKEIAWFLNNEKKRILKNTGYLKMTRRMILLFIMMVYHNSSRLEEEM